MATTATESLSKSDSPSKSETTTEDVKLYVNEQRYVGLSVFNDYSCMMYKSINQEIICGFSSIKLPRMA